MAPTTRATTNLQAAMEEMTTPALATRVEDSVDQTIRATISPRAGMEETTILALETRAVVGAMADRTTQAATNHQANTGEMIIPAPGIRVVDMVEVMIIVRVGTTNLLVAPAAASKARVGLREKLSRPERAF